MYGSIMQLDCATRVVCEIPRLADCAIAASCGTLACGLLRFGLSIAAFGATGSFPQSARAQCARVGGL